jgi:hypothetical protein
MKPTYVLISFPYPDPDFVEAKCSLCSAVVYEQQANLDRLDAEDFVVCVPCAVRLKLAMPGNFPALEGQLWNGHVREPVVGRGNETIAALLNWKPKER